MSLPGAFPVIRVNLNASAPYLSITSNGSIPFPKDFDILRPCESLTSPCIKTVSKGTSPVCSSPENIILITQKGIISYPVTNVLVG